MASITLSCASLLSCALLVSACTQADGDYGFRIQQVHIQPAYQGLATRYEQELSLSGEAEEALEHGVPLTVQIDMELRDSLTLTLLTDHSQRFEIRYLPLSQHYRLTGLDDGSERTFPRLRHALGALGRLELDFSTGPLAPGAYEFRVRTRIDNSRLPAPMQLPARFSSQWQHDSEWSTWPFEINA
jgi:hypothetical protein